MPNFKKNPTPFMMKGKSPMMKALVGKQLAAPTKMYGGSKNAGLKMKHGSAMKGYKSDAQRKAVHASKAEKSPAKMKKTMAKKTLTEDQMKLPAELRKAIEASPATMLKPAAMKMMKQAAMKMKKK